jgi:penicillin V acylase-like amidase (Ntn superfamily)
MHFYGDYELPDFTPQASLPQDIRCTCFSVKTEQGNQLLGRNFDWEDHPALLLYTDPPDRYASVSMVDISYLGYAKSDAPEENPGGLLRSPLLPFDGMNEKGLAVGMGKKYNQVHEFDLKQAIAIERSDLKIGRNMVEVFDGKEHERT